MRASLEAHKPSKSRASRRQREIQALVRSTTHLLGRICASFGNDRVPVHFLSDGGIGAFDASPRMVHDFYLDAQGVFDPLLALAIVASISPDQLETRERITKRSQQQQGSMSIQNVGGMDFD